MEIKNWVDCLGPRFGGRVGKASVLRVLGYGVRGKEAKACMTQDAATTGVVY